MSGFNFEDAINKMPINDNIKTLTFYGLCQAKLDIEKLLEPLQRLGKNRIIGATGLRMLITMRTQLHAREWLDEYKTTEAAVEALKDRFVGESPNTTIKQFQETLNSIAVYAQRETTDETEAPAPVVQEDDILSMWRNN